MRNHLIGYSSAIIVSFFSGLYLNYSVNSIETKEGCTKSSVIEKGGIPHNFVFYDANCDDIPERAAATKKGSQYPVFYWEDKNHNMDIDDGEVLLDPKEDGLNGNESSINPKNLEGIIEV